MIDLFSSYKRIYLYNLSLSHLKEGDNPLSLPSLTLKSHQDVPSFVSYKKGCTRLAAVSDKVYQLLVHGRWLSPGTPASSTTKTCRHDIAEILLKVT